MISKLLKKSIDVKESCSIVAGDYCNSGGTESSGTENGTDTGTRTYNDDCAVSSVRWIVHY